MINETKEKDYKKYKNDCQCAWAGCVLYAMCGYNPLGFFNFLTLRLKLQHCITKCKGIIEFLFLRGTHETDRMKKEIMNSMHQKSKSISGKWKLHIMLWFITYMVLHPYYISSKWKPFWQKESSKKIWGKRWKI